MRNLANKQTNKQTDKQKILSTQKFELSTLAFLAQGSYRLNYRAVLIWLLLSEHYYEINLLWIWLKSWSNQDLQITVIRIQQDILDRNSVLDIHYVLFWGILLTNRQTKKFVHTEVQTLDPRVFSTMLLPTEPFGRTQLITIITLLIPDSQKFLATQRFELSTLAFLPQCSYRLSYRAVLIRLLLSEHYYEINLLWIWLKSWSNQDLWITFVRIQQDILDRNPVVDIQYLLFSEILLTNKQTNKQTNKNICPQRGSNSRPSRL